MPLANCVTHDRAENTSRLRQWVAGEASAGDSADLAESHDRHSQGEVILTETQSASDSNLLQVSSWCHASRGKAAIR